MNEQEVIEPTKAHRGPVGPTRPASEGSQQLAAKLMQLHHEFSLKVVLCVDPEKLAEYRVTLERAVARLIDQEIHPLYEAAEAGLASIQVYEEMFGAPATRNIKRRRIEQAIKLYR